MLVGPGAIAVEAVCFESIVTVEMLKPGLVIEIVQMSCKATGNWHPGCLV